MFRLNYSYWVCIVYLVGSFFVLGCSNHKTIPPGSYIIPPFNDIGEIKTGETVKTSFFLVNNTNRVLEIEEIVPSCGCTKVDIGTYKVPPFSQTSLEVSVEITSGLGEQDFRIIVKTKEKLLICGIKCVVFSDKMVSFNYNLGQFYPGQVFSKIITIGSPDWNDSSITNAVFQSGHPVTFSYIEKDVRMVQVHGKAPYQEGKFISEVTFYSDGKWKAVDVGLVGKVVSSWTVIPRDFFLGSIDKNEHYNIEITIAPIVTSVLSEKKWILINDSEASGFAALLLENENNLVIRIHGQSPKTSGQFSSLFCFRLKSDDGIEESFSIPVFGIVK
jgi:hypothetical protein